MTPPLPWYIDPIDRRKVMLRHDGPRPLVVATFTTKGGAALALHRCETQPELYEALKEFSGGFRPDEIPDYVTIAIARAEGRKGEEE